MKNNRNLSSYFINLPFQIRFIAYTLVINLILSGCFLMSARMFFDSFDQMGRSAGFPEDHVFFRFMEKQQETLYTNLAWSVLLVTIIAIIYGVKQSHKIAGPIYRLKIELQQMQKTKTLKKIKFRDKDFFQEIPENFNQVVASIKDSQEIT